MANKHMKRYLQCVYETSDLYIFLMGNRKDLLVKMQINSVYVPSLLASLKSRSAGFSKIKISKGKGSGDEN